MNITSDIKTHPLVSIIITNYNREKTIATAIESALAQDYPNLEIIISDNCSTDNSVYIINQYIEDFRIHFFRNEENIGMFNNFKICFEERALGDYISIVNSDDKLINPRFISQSVELINKFENVVLVKSESEFYKNGNIFYQYYREYNEFYTGLDLLQTLDPQHDFGWCGIVIKKETINAFKIWDKQIINADLLSNLWICTQGNICFNKNLSYLYVVHGENISYNSYSIDEINRIISELFELLNVLPQKTSAIIFNDISRKLAIRFFPNILLSTYIDYRNIFFSILKTLFLINSSIVFSSIYKNKTYFLLYVVPSIGKWLTKVKKKYVG